eukprot:SM000043S15849  [mRNA]  locus=s43:497721:500388:+ [translate_table: standard]
MRAVPLPDDSGGDCWLLNEPAQGLPFLLADAGFDVWIGNTRASRWSHGHVALQPTAEAYWDWTWDDLAGEDLPSMFRYVRQAANGSQIFYIGHSQGTITGLATFTNPADVEHVRAAVLLSPIIHLNHIKSKFVKAAATLYLDKVVKKSGFRQFNLNSGVSEELVGRVCELVGMSIECNHLLTAITGPPCCMNMSEVRRYLEWEPGTTSVKNMIHLAQMVRTGTWSKFDYGWVRNLCVYGSLRPPQYRLSKIPKSISLMLAHGGADYLSDEDDVRSLIDGLKPRPRLLYLPQYAHGDFILSTSGRQDLYNPIIDFLHGELLTQPQITVQYDGHLLVY